jgi:hypothetical protein
MERSSRAQVIGHPLQPLEKIQSRQPQTADKREDRNGQKERRAFEGFEFHRPGLNKKPEQLKAALATLKDSGLPDVKILPSPALLPLHHQSKWPRPMAEVCGFAGGRRNINYGPVIRERNDSFHEGDGLDGSLSRAAQFLRRKLGHFARGGIKSLACHHGCRYG